MPIETIAEEKKLPEGSDDQPPAVTEEILAQQRDPDEAALAELAIRDFVRDRLGEWYAQMETAINGLETWVYAHTAEQQSLFSSRGFFDFLGDKLIGELFAIAGGAGTPIMDAIVGEVSNTVTFAQRTEFEIGYFLNQCRRGVRDACWFVRDSSQSLLTNQWPALLDLAYEGSYDFVPMLYTLGLPTTQFTPAAFTSKLVAQADGYQQAMEPTRQQAVEQAPSEKKQEEVIAETRQLDQITEDQRAVAL